MCADYSYVNYESVASELIRALRAKRSQPALSRRLGYRSNVVYLWEAGRAFPTAAKAMAVAQRVGVEPSDAIRRFYRKPGQWLGEQDFTTRQGITALLQDLRGRSSVAELARNMRRDRYAISRWLSGATEPRLPEFLHLVDVCTLRLPDLLACFVDPLALPAIRRQWRALQASRATVNDAPWSHAVLRALELSDYRALTRHEPGWIARRIGITPEEEQRCLTLLSRSDQIRLTKQRWVPRGVATVDTRHEPGAARKLARWCAGRATDCLDDGKPGNFAFNVFSVSEGDLERLRALQRDYFAQLRTIVQHSQPAERIVVANMHLFALDGEGEQE
jgi:transcriptional regulator with XRE-family HTH domain